MARTRMLHPEFFVDDFLVTIPPLARLLFAGLWCYADREGRLEDKPFKLKLEILPNDDCNINELLDILADPNEGVIKRYQVNGNKYIQIKQFTKYQHIHFREQYSEIPDENGVLPEGKEKKPGASPRQAPDKPQTSPPASASASASEIPLPPLDNKNIQLSINTDQVLDLKKRLQETEKDTDFVEDKNGNWQDIHPKYRKIVALVNKKYGGFQRFDTPDHIKVLKEISEYKLNEIEEKIDKALSTNKKMKPISALRFALKILNDKKQKIDNRTPEQINYELHLNDAIGEIKKYKEQIERKMLKKRGAIGCINKAIKWFDEYGDEVLKETITNKAYWVKLKEEADVV